MKQFKNNKVYKYENSTKSNIYKCGHVECKVNNNIKVMIYLKLN